MSRGPPAGRGIFADGILSEARMNGILPLVHRVAGTQSQGRELPEQGQ